jgi:uncharacterized protein (DUF342 family)
MVEFEKETALDFDEFVAHLWRNGIISGVRAADIRSFISNGTGGMQVVASGRPPAPGENARVKEEKKDIRKNMAPKEYASGMFDFGQFTVSFPEVKK